MLSQPTPPGHPETLECQVCESPVDLATGYLACDISHAQAALRGEAYPAPWAPTHGECCDTGTYYSIELNDLTNPRRILWWNAHLRHKNWMAGSAWGAYMDQESGQRYGS